MPGGGNFRDGQIGEVEVLGLLRTGLLRTGLLRTGLLRTGLLRTLFSAQDYCAQDYSAHLRTGLLRTFLGSTTVRPVPAVMHFICSLPRITHTHTLKGYMRNI